MLYHGLRRGHHGFAEGFYPFFVLSWEKGDMLQLFESIQAWRAYTAKAGGWTGGLAHPTFFDQ